MNQPRSLRKERGVVLLLILGLMAMFAMIVLTFMIVTSNLAETAKNVAEKETIVEVSVKSDCYDALRTLVAGSNNRMSPIAPFGVLENLYGDYTRWLPSGGSGNGQWFDNSFEADIELFDNLDTYTGNAVTGNYVTTHVKVFWTSADADGDGFDDYDWENLKIESGTVIVFDKANGSGSNTGLWNQLVAGTASHVVEKVLHPDDGTNVPYLKVSLTDSLKQFFNVNGTVAVNAHIRLNQPVFSGTGAGHFYPYDHEHFDGSPIEGGGPAPISPKDRFRVPYAKWANASAPDMIPFQENGNTFISAQSFWAHLINGLYNPFEYDLAAGTDRYMTWSGAAGWNAQNPIVDGHQQGKALQPVKMHPSYTAPDQRTLFLAWYADNNPNTSQITPSFHRPDLMDWFLIQTTDHDGDGDPDGTLGGTANVNIFGSTARTWADAGGNSITESAYSTVDALSVLRKLTPRPLQLDHWDFTGSNSSMDLGVYLSAKLNPTDPYQSWQARLNNSSAARPMNFYTQHLATLLQAPMFLPGIDLDADTYDDPYPGSWDVDNDNDGVKDGIWVYSGLPIRTNKNGVPYATMYSFTILDMDGRVNVNTAGSWDQLPLFYNGSTNAVNPYISVTDVDAVSGLAGSVGTFSPFYDMESLQALGKEFAWKDDLDGTGYIPDIDEMQRGAGLGPASVALYRTLGDLGFAYPAADPRFQLEVAASNMMWRRNIATNEQMNNIPINGLDSSGNPFAWNAATLQRDSYNNAGTTPLFPQPGTVYTGGVQYSSSSVIRNYSLYNPIVVWNGITPGTTPNDVVFPWRGKTRVEDWSLAPNNYPKFDFADTGLRSYDPLGHQTYTYAARISENPYQLDSTKRSPTDNAYPVTALERLLRFYDSDTYMLPDTLINDLTNNGDMFPNVPNARLALAGKSLTTISSDIPAAAMTFIDTETSGVVGSGFEGGGAYGIYALIQKCVTSELSRAMHDGGAAPNPRKNLLRTIEDAVASSTMTRAHADDLINAFNTKVNEITDYLVALLPEETLLGKKVDLNKLSQKAYWLDLEFKAHPASGGASTFTQGAGIDDGDPVLVKPSSLFAHHYGLTKRMEFARGLYILMMALTYEDRNADDIYPNIVYDYDYDGDTIIPDGFNGTTLRPDGSTMRNYNNYFEGAFDLEITKASNSADGIKNKELIANRIAQWCVNLVDFSDPDATMTPFYYDVNPFDGWWSFNKLLDQTTYLASVDLTAALNALNDCLTPSFNTISGKTAPISVQTMIGGSWTDNYSPKRQMNQFFAEAFDELDASYNAVQYKFSPVLPVAEQTFSDQIRFWLCDLEFDSAGTALQQRASASTELDRGFRCVWGMERPDLAITETMSFHDLGIADSDIAEGAPSNGAEGGTTNHVADGDKHFDQVRRPKGSTYLEVVCTANPNVPQSSELYDYDEVKDNAGNPVVDAGGNPIKRWQLNLSKMTPSYNYPMTTPVQNSNFPVWRLAISDSRLPADVPPTTPPEPYFRKDFNNVLKRVKLGVEVYSLQTKQFRNLPLPSVSGGTDVGRISDIDCHPTLPAGGKFDPSWNWQRFNLQTSNTYRWNDPTMNDAVSPTAEEKEIQLDRIVWFVGNTSPDSDNSAGAKLGAFGCRPDALRIFASTATGNVHLSPNQYLVLGPEKVRSIGSWQKTLTANEVYDLEGKRNGSPTVYTAGGSGDYGIPSLNNIDLAALSPIGSGNYKYLEVKSCIGSQGLNISEPLWLCDATDPYLVCTSGTIAKTPPLAAYTPFLVRDKPFEMPQNWGDNGYGPAADNFHFPIAEDGLFGHGVVPAYKSIFVQRVADPNRPYHPMLNPYLTVDWNVMDLAVFTGESTDVMGPFPDNQTDTDFCIPATGNTYPFSANNQIKLAKEDSLDIAAAATIKVEDVFSSRQWGKTGTTQRAFNPYEQEKYRPNILARAFNFKGITNGGLEKGTNEKATGGKLDTNPPTSCQDVAAVIWSPEHTFGFYNDRGTATVIGGGATNNWYTKLNPNFYNMPWSVYYGAPIEPFEHLVWNDAPMASPWEMAMVPASAPGRFGLEFIRNPATGNKDYDFKALFGARLNNKTAPDPDTGGTALGTAGFRSREGGPFGFDFDKANNKPNAPSNKGDVYNKLGPYLNFFGSSNFAGRSLNLGKFTEFVRVASLEQGARKQAGNDFFEIQTGMLAGAVIDDTMREPGKINLNTVIKPGWLGLGGSDSGDTPNAIYDDFNKARYAFAYQPSNTALLHAYANMPFDFSKYNFADPYWPSYLTIGRRPVSFDDADADSDPAAGAGTADETNPLFAAVTGGSKRGNMYAATEELQRMSNLTTNRSNVFAVWLTVGYFEVNRVDPGVNMPLYDPDGVAITTASLANPAYKYYYYYKAIYPDGYTFGKELGGDTGDLKRHRSFSLIDRSIPTDFRRGNSWRWEDTILLHRVLE